MSIQLQGNNDSVFSNDVIAPNIPTQGQIVGYQQGIWLPTLNSRESSDPTTYFVVADATYNTLYHGGWWTRVGNLVSFGGAFRLASKGTVAGGLFIGGLPYVATVMVPGGPPPYGQGRSAMTLGSISTGLTNSVNGKTFSCRLISSAASIDPETDAQRNIRLTSWRLGLYDVDTHTASDLEADQITSSFYLTTFGGSYITDDTTWTPINGATLS